MPAKEAPRLTAAFSPLSIIRMLWKRKVAVVVWWLAVTAIAAGYVTTLNPIYSAEALVLVDSQKIPEKFVASTVSTDVQDRLATISQQILSSTLLKKIIDDYDLYKEERKTHVQEEVLDMMRRDISIKLERGWTGNRPGAFRIAYQGSDPALVAQVANRVANLFIEENLKTREVQAEGTSEFIDTQMGEARKRLDDLEAAVGVYKVKHNGELPQQESVISGTLSRLQGEMQSHRDSLNHAEESKLVLDNTLKVAEATVAALNRISVQAGSAPETGVPAAPGAAPQQAARVVKASDQIRAQIVILRTRYSETHPDVKRLTADLARVVQLEEQQRREREAAAQSAAPAPPATNAPVNQPAPATAANPPANPAPATSVANAPENPAATTTAANPPAKPASPAPAPAPQKGAAAAVVDTRRSFELGQALERVVALRAEVAVKDREIELHKAELQRLTRDMNAAQGRLERLPLHEQEMAKITRDYEISKANYRSLLDKKFSAEMATDMERRQKSERFTILDPARVPEKPTQPNRKMLDLVASMAGLLLGLFFGIGKELRKNVILGEWELPPGYTVLGRLPYISPISRPSKLRRLLASRKMRFAVLSSAVLSLLGVTAVGVYYLRTHF